MFDFRWFWLIALILTVPASIYSMEKLITSLRKTPIIIYTDDDPVSVTDIYFPAVTFCPGIIIESNSLIPLNYDRIINDLKNNRTTIDDISESKLMRD
jgi:hypothetical protein